MMEAVYFIIVMTLILCVAGAIGKVDMLDSINEKRRRDYAPRQDLDERKQITTRDQARLQAYNPKLYREDRFEKDWSND